MTFLSDFAHRIFRFLASLKLAVVVLLSLAFVLCLGTFYESLYGTAVAKEKVYSTAWFSLVLLFLGVNVLCAALSRWPWKKHHLGFVITHAGILILLAGAFLTQQFGVEGSLALAEGEEEDRIVLDEPLFQVGIPDLRKTDTFPARFSQKPPTEQKPWIRSLPDGSQLAIDRFYTHASPILEVKEGKEFNPALKIMLSGLPGGVGEVTEWLFLKESIYGRPVAQMGPAKILFVDEKALRELRSAEDAGTQKIGVLKLQLEMLENTKPLVRNFEIRVEEALKREVVLEETSLKIKILRYLPDAVVENKQLVSRSDQPNNPALEFRISGEGIDQTHLAFAKFPDLGSIHANRYKDLRVKSEFFPERNVAGSAGAELYLAANQDRQILYRIRKRGKLGEIQNASLHQKINTGWMTIQFQVLELFSKADPRVLYRKVLLPPGKTEGPPPAVRFTLQKEKENAKVEGWIQQGDIRTVTLNGAPYILRYGLKAHPLGLRLKLKKFEIERYPGNNAPSSFMSTVEVEDLKTGQRSEEKIFMNNPLHYNGFTFYQSSYNEGEGGGPMVSIFSVAKDPGKWIKYLGSIVMVCGIALMFWFKPLFIQKRKKAKEDHRAHSAVNQTNLGWSSR